MYDVAIVGAGIAGASLAAEVAPHASVLLIEAEDQPGYHATGRSAAFWDESYGGPAIQPLTTASGPWLETGGFLDRRGALYIGRAADEPAIAAFEAAFLGTGVILEREDAQAIRARVPGIRAQWDRAIWEPSCADIDVAALHQWFLSEAKRAGALLRCGSALQAAERQGDVWKLDAGGSFSARILVDAAGAWADDVARLAGAAPLGVRPFRRTIVQLTVEPPPDQLPLVLDINGSFYFKSEAGGRLWLSPHEETPCDPCDAAPEEIDVATAIDRLEQVVDWRVGRVERKWAGLRSFAPDRLPIYGFDPRLPGFFWCAGQGGFGIQTAPAAAKLAAALLLSLEPDPIVAHIEARAYRPERFG